MNNGILKVY